MYKELLAEGRPPVSESIFISKRHICELITTKIHSINFSKHYINIFFVNPPSFANICKPQTLKADLALSKRNFTPLYPPLFVLYSGDLCGIVRNNV